MRTALKVLSTIFVVLGGLCVLVSVTSYEPGDLVGGGLYLGMGILTLCYLGQEKKK